MALIHCDGFDYYTHADGLLHWTGYSPTALSTSITRYPSVASLQASATGVITSCCAYRSFGVNYVSGVLGYAFYSTVTVASRVHMLVLDGVIEQISVRTNGSGVLTVTRNGTLLATGTTVLSQNTWYYIELKFTIATGTGGTVELKLNGVSEIASTSSLNTRNTANTQFNGIGIGNVASQFYDDIYLLDTTAGSNTNFLGPVSILTLGASENGSTTSWSPNGGSNVGCVKDVYEDGDVSFNQSATANQIDTFVMEDLPAASGSVYAVAARIITRQDAGAARTIAPVLRPTSTDRVGTTKALSSSYQCIEQLYDVSPDTSSAWSVSEINSLQVGYKLIS